MANRRYVFEKNWEENPPPRRPASSTEILPGWTPVRIECTHFRRPDDTPEILLLYGSPCSPTAAARHQQLVWPDTTAIDTREQHRSPEPHQVEGATRVVRLAGMLSLDELRDDEDYYQDVLADVRIEARKFGDLLKVVVPRHGHAGAGKVFLEYGCLDDSIRCMIRMDERWFDGRKVIAGYYPEDRFAAADYGYDG